MSDSEKKELEEVNEFEIDEVEQEPILSEVEVEQEEVVLKKEKKVKEKKEKVKKEKPSKSKEVEETTENAGLHQVKLSSHDHILNHDEIILARALEFSLLDSAPKEEITNVLLKLPKQIYRPLDFNVKHNDLENVYYDQIHYTVVSFYKGICYVYESDVVASSPNSVISDQAKSFYIDDVVTLKHTIKSNEKKTAFEVDFYISLINQETVSLQLANYFDSKSTLYDYSSTKEVLSLLYEYFRG